LDYYLFYYRKEYCVDAVKAVEKLGLQEYIRIDWRDILGVNINELRAFNFTHIMTSAAVGELFYLRVMQVGMLLRIPTLISRVSVQAVQREYHVFDSRSNQIQYVEKFCSAELQRENDDDKKECRNVAIVATNVLGLPTEKRIHGALVNQLKQELLKYYGRLDKGTNKWSVKAKPFPEKWASNFEKFSKLRDINIFNADARTNSVAFQYEPMPHVVSVRLQITVADMIRYSENQDEFFSYVQAFFVEAFIANNFFLFDKEQIDQLNVGEITDTVMVRVEDVDYNEERVRKRKGKYHKINKKRRKIHRKKDEENDEEDEFQVDQENAVELDDIETHDSIDNDKQGDVMEVDEI
jgi:hypothetical protein